MMSRNQWHIAVQECLVILCVNYPIEIVFTYCAQWWYFSLDNDSNLSPYLVEWNIILTLNYFLFDVINSCEGKKYIKEWSLSPWFLVGVMTDKGDSFQTFVCNFELHWSLQGTDATHKENLLLSNKLETAGKNITTEFCLLKWTRICKISQRQNWPPVRFTLFTSSNRP